MHHASIRKMVMNRWSEPRPFRGTASDTLRRKVSAKVLILHLHELAVLELALRSEVGRRRNAP